MCPIGLFSVKERDEFADSLAEKYDVHKFDVAAFSALGYYDDPLVSTMKKWPYWYLSKTIFHELVHRNFWLKSSSSVNELIAEAIAVDLSRQFLKKSKKIDAFKNLEDKLKTQKRN